MDTFVTLGSVSKSVVEKINNRKYWTGHVPTKDDFGDPIKNVFIDGKTKHGPWAFMTPASWRIHGVGQYGIGYGQRYTKNLTTGQWLKTEG